MNAQYTLAAGTPLSKTCLFYATVNGTSLEFEPDCFPGERQSIVTWGITDVVARDSSLDEDDGLCFPGLYRRGTVTTWANHSPKFAVEAYLERERATAASEIAQEKRVAEENLERDRAYSRLR